MTSIAGNVTELFVSIQGEGLFAGERHIFVRTAGCRIACNYCDSRYSTMVPEQCAVYGPERRLLSNPVGIPTVLEEIAALEARLGPVAAVSITGGEPLEQCDFVALLAEELQIRNSRVYLDTNGIEVEGFSRVVSHVDIVAADIKLPSSGAGDHWAAHRRFLRVASGAGIETFIKVVIDTNTCDDEFIMAVEMVTEIDPRIPLVLQPESGTLMVKTDAARLLMERVIGYQTLAAERLETVRVIPQIHRILGVR